MPTGTTDSADAPTAAAGPSVPGSRRVLAPTRRALAAAQDVAREAAAGHTRLRIGYAWSAMGRHTVAFQRLGRPSTRTPNSS